MTNWIPLIFILTALNVQAFNVKKYKVDEKSWDKKRKVNLLSGKRDDSRFYKGERTDIITADLESSLKAVLNFEDKCNNDLKEYRKFFSKKKKCSYHNKSLVETKIVRDIKKFYTPEENEVERFLMQRNIYNRNSYSHVDLLTVFKKQNDLGQTVYRVNIRKLKDKEAKKYMKNPVKHESVFDGALSYFELTQVDKEKTQLIYSYTTWTDHWLLNKSVAVSKVFNNVAKGISLLFKSIHHEANKIKPSSVAKKKSIIQNHALNN
jgi:hypothetical protein